MSFVQAATLSSSPSSLSFNLEPGEEECKILNIYSSDYTGDLYSVMRWAEKDIEVNHPRDFTLTNEEVSLNVIYSSKEIKNFDGEEQIEICIGGDEIGEYKSSLEYRTESEGNIGIGVGTVINVNIEEKSEEPVPDNGNTGGDNGGGGSGGGAATTTPTTTSTITTTSDIEDKIVASVNNVENKTVEDFDEEDGDEKLSKITGAVIGSVKGNLYVIIITIAVIAIVAFYVYNKRGKDLVKKIENNNHSV